jgi:hypothetical protein
MAIYKYLKDLEKKNIKWECCKNFCKFVFPCHPEDFRPKDLFFDFLTWKEKYEILRFAQNDGLDFLEQPTIKVDLKIKQCYIFYGGFEWKGILYLLQT